MIRKSELAVLPTTKQLSRPAGAVAHQLAFNEYVVAANTTHRTVSVYGPCRARSVPNQHGDAVVYELGASGIIFTRLIIRSKRSDE